MMKRFCLGLMLFAPLALAACEGMTPTERTTTALVGGAAAGLITAEALEADNNWRLIAGLTGAAVGTMVAHNTATDMCAYARGDGTYYYAPCP
jgi:hypothetical protein